MKTLFTKIKRSILKLYAWVPTKIPVGVTEQGAWVNSIIALYGFPDNDSLRFAISTMVLHLGATEARKPKRFFYLSVSAGMSRQVAAEAMKTLKDKQIAQAAAAAAVPPPPILTVVPDAAQ